MVSAQRFGDVFDRLTPVVSAATRAHVALYRLTGGRIGHTAPGAPTMLLLDHVGARSGAARTTPLLYLPDGDDLVIVASAGGHPRHPAWLHNLRAHPDTTVQVRDEVRPVRAREADESERARLWPRLDAMYGSFVSYRRRADEVGRVIPLVILERRPAGPPS
ncbi:nitroreductase family deazaflavin-dependent oxidoreductase [Actinomycetospora chiangmaiensis]|uniref:nitroreductase family deazaflavin-dependent oxidoreductase n=1 Tax=Actinomycetospora chiangmaiensis TaxID=402650 RepID=UPI0003665950|nr:nitroreductase family deazaflavin-dependent oxidoreductase [Actinomycetospora chiangmaiensis]